MVLNSFYLIILINIIILWFFIGFFCAKKDEYLADMRHDDFC